MERSFKEEVGKLTLGQGQTFHGEGILAVTKALLQSGVAYVGGYQGAPVSHMMDVLNDARDIMDKLGIHVETNANEAGAAAMLGASINYPLRGAVTFKSTVGTNVAADALSNVASAGVKGGALIILGEDYGEGSSIIQERSHAFAMKSQIWLLDPRPNLPKMVEAVEQAFALSEASSTPVMLELRIRACHVHGSFSTKDNRAAAFSKNNFLAGSDFDYNRICLPPATYAQEKHKIDVRWPAAVRFIREQKLNEVFPGDRSELGIICQGGMYNAVIRALQLLGLADPFGASRIPIYCLNVTYPLVPEEITGFSRDKKAVLVVEEGQPAFIEDAILAVLRRAEANGVRIHGKDILPLAGEYTGEVVLSGVSRFLGMEKSFQPVKDLKQKAAELLGAGLPVRPPGF
jgi:indolepyruvate ferredoxin oxidoreductase alpha subunit